MTKEKDEIKIRISGLANGTHEYHFTVQPEDLALPAEFLPPIAVDVTLDKAARQIFLKAAISAPGTFTCDRCLERVENHLESAVSLFFAHSETDSGKFPAEEIRVITPDAPYIDITDDVRQAILLSVPLKLLCNEGCKGLCPHCGVNWNTTSCDCIERDEMDPRWENLKHIL